MPRLREVPRAEVTDERILFFYDRLFGPDKDPAADHGTATGSPGDWWTVVALSPEPVVEVAAPEGYGDRDIANDLTGDPAGGAR